MPPEADVTAQQQRSAEGGGGGGGGAGRLKKFNVMLHDETALIEINLVPKRKILIKMGFYPISTFLLTP